MEKAIVGFDGRDLSSDALALAKELTRIEGAELHVAVVLPHNPIPLEKEKYEKALADHFEELFAQAKRSSKAREFVAERLDDPSPSKALNDLAETEEADAIVLGSTHRGLLGRSPPAASPSVCLSRVTSRGLAAPRGDAGRRARGLRDRWCWLRWRRASPSSQPRLPRRLARNERWDRASHWRGSTDPARSLAQTTGCGGQCPADFPRSPPGASENGARGRASAVGDTKVESELNFGEPAMLLRPRGGELDLLALGSRSDGPVPELLLAASRPRCCAAHSCPVRPGDPRSSE